MAATISPYKNQGYEQRGRARGMKSTGTLKQNTFVGLDPADGLLKQWSDSATLIWQGFIERDAPNIPQTSAGYAEVNRQGGVWPQMSVAGVASQANVGDAVYCATNNPADLSLTKTTLAKRIGTVIGYHSGAICDVQFVTPEEYVLDGVVGLTVKRGVAAVTGSATVVTGLSTVVAVVATAVSDLDGDTLAGVSATIGDQAGAPDAGSVILKAWKNQGDGDATMVAATVAKSLNWVAIGVA